MSANTRSNEMCLRYYKYKLFLLRTIELKEILARMKMSVDGNKQDLGNRILPVIKDEIMTGKKNDVSKLVDEIYQLSFSSKVDGKELVKIRCVCGITSGTEGMIRCEDQTCGVWQHKQCVFNNNNIPARVPRTFYCDMCRLSRADPFSVTLPRIPLPATKTGAQTISESFVLTSWNMESLKKKEYEVQAWCMLLNDVVPFRFQWPTCVELKVNDAAVKTAERSGMMFGANSRDDGVNISEFTKVGINSICITNVKDTRLFCFGVRFVKRRTVQEVLELVPGESVGEKLEDAVARVRRCVSGGGDDDVEAVSDHVPVSLRCPMSGSRIKIAGRFKPCVHMGCFDLEAFLEMNMRSKKWQCPVCLKNYCVNDIIIDPYFNRITARLQNLGFDVNEVELKSDGSWRAKSDDDNGGNNCLWHSPDGSVIEDQVLQAVAVTGNIEDIHQFGDAEVIALSDSEEEDETDDCRGRENCCQYSVPTKRPCESFEMDFFNKRKRFEDGWKKGDGNMTLC